MITEQYCGLIQSPLDAWLFGQINGGNCISLALNFGYGWATDINLWFVFDIRKAERVLDWKPQVDWYDFERRTWYA